MSNTERENYTERKKETRERNKMKKTTTMRSANDSFKAQTCKKPLNVV